MQLLAFPGLSPGPDAVVERFVEPPISAMVDWAHFTGHVRIRFHFTTGDVFFYHGVYEFNVTKVQPPGTVRISPMRIFLTTDSHPTYLYILDREPFAFRRSNDPSIHYTTVKTFDRKCSCPVKNDGD